MITNTGNTVTIRGRFRYYKVGIDVVTIYDSADIAGAVTIGGKFKILAIKNSIA